LPDWLTECILQTILYKSHHS